MPVIPPTNLLSDPGFESGVSLWTPWPSKTTRTQDAAVFRNGSKSMEVAQIDVDGSVGVNSVWRVVTGLTVGQAYKFSAYVQRGAGPQCMVYIAGASMGTNPVAIPNAVWTRIEILFVATSTSETMTIGDTANFQTTSFYVDDVSLVESRIPFTVPGDITLPSFVIPRMSIPTTGDRWVDGWWASGSYELLGADDLVVLHRPENTPAIHLKASNFFGLRVGNPPGGPVYSVTTERIYRRLPEVYRVLDAQNDWQFKTYIASLGDQLNDIDTLIARLELVLPENRARHYESQDEYNTYARPAGLEDTARGWAPIAETSDLFDGRTADADWLPWIAQILGATSIDTTNEAQLRDAMYNNYLGYQAGSRKALLATVRSMLTGTKTVAIYPHHDGAGDDIASIGTMWDVLLVTQLGETPMSSADLIAEIIERGAKPAGVVLHHLIDDSGSGILPVPTFSHTGLGEFTITNYNPAFTYHLSAGSHVGALVRLPNPNSFSKIWVDDGVDTSPKARIERKAYTVTIIGPLESYETAGGCPAGWNYEDYGWVKYCRRYGSTKNPTPVGYTDDNGEWWKVT